jgi:hypothetical protein
MVRLEYGLTEEIQSATDMGEPQYRAAAMYGFLVCSATRSHSQTGRNVRSQSAEAWLRLTAVRYSRAGGQRVSEDAGGSGLW